MYTIVWIEQVSIGRPMVSERDKDAVERRIFPGEVRSLGRQFIFSVFC